MEEDKAMNLVDKIEKLITGGNKEILDRIGGLENGQKELKGGQKELSQAIKTIDRKIDTNTNALYGLLKDVREDIKKVSDRLAEHTRQPAHAA